MSILQVSGISISFGAVDILVDVSLNLAAGSRMALTGANGSGKTTLMKIMAGLAKPDSGKIVTSAEGRISYLPQSGLEHSSSSLFDEADKAFARFRLMDGRLREIEHALAEVREESAETAALLIEHHTLHERIEDGGYHTRDSVKERILTGLGFRQGDFDRETSEFSGGWQMRIALAKVLLEEPDILLLDEPTNYLDIDARTWLESHIAGFKGAVLIVSHDRYFLDTTVSSVAELFLGRIKVYKGNFTEYEKRRTQELHDLLERHRRQQEEIQRVEYFIGRFRSNASKANQVQDRIRYLESLEIIEVPESMKRIRIDFPQPPRSGNDVLRLEGVTRRFGGVTALDGVDLVVERGERIVIAGANGAGKSTLLRIIAGQDRSFQGSMVMGKGVLPAYFAQDLDDPGRFQSSVATGDGDTIIEQLETMAPTHLIPKLRDMLGGFLFRGDDIYKRVEVLSGGERSRLEILKLLLKPINFLILDEPTNHLDMTSKEVLLDALSRYEGTVVFVSHDRFFIERLATNVLELESGRHRLFPGDYAYYLFRKRQESGADGVQEERSGDPVREPLGSETAADWKADKVRKTEMKRLDREEERTLAELESLTEEKGRLEADMADPSVYIDGGQVREIMDAIRRNTERQEELTSIWERLEERRKGLAG